MVADTDDINLPLDSSFVFDGTWLSLIDPMDVSKADIYYMKVYARYDGTLVGDVTHYTRYATLEI